jgi:hypothetical protein
VAGTSANYGSLLHQNAESAFGDPAMKHPVAVVMPRAAVESRPAAALAKHQARALGSKSGVRGVA